MIRRLPARKSNALAVAGIALALVLFLAMNLLATTTLSRVRLDLTEGRLHTLSGATRATLADIQEPITLRLYVSDALTEGNPLFADHARRVRELLGHYVDLADGMLRLKVLRPEPYSEVEDQALADGLRPLPLGDGSQSGYFGLAGTNSTDDQEAIAFFAPDRASFLEYDLTRLIHDLAHPVKPVVGVIGSLPMLGDPMRGRPAWRVVELMKESYEVRPLPAEPRRIDAAEVDVLLLAQPAGLSEAARYAIDQYVQRGGRVLAFLDPFSELQAARQRRQGEAAAGVTMDRGLAPLLSAWGVRIDPDSAIGDRGNAQRVRARVDGRSTVVDFIAWLTLDGEDLAGDDPVTARLSQLDLRSAGAIETLPDAGTTLTPLATASDQAMRLEVARLRDFPNPAKLLSEFWDTEERYTYAARVTGPTRTAFPDGPPEAVDDPEIRAAHLAASETDSHIILVADSDLLANDTWTRPRELGGQRVSMPVANNGDFVVNALDSLSGGGALIDLRGRGLVRRPFTLIEEMRREAEAKYRAREQALQQRIDDARKRMRELRLREARTGVVMTAEQKREMERLRDDLLAARRELREVRHKLHADVERVQTLVRAGNIWGMPALVALVAVGLGLARRLRRRRRPAAAG